MVRQARSYLAGAVSGTALIGVAVVAFVVLVSLQTLREWPLAGIGGGDAGLAESTQARSPVAAGNGAGAGVTAAAEGARQGGSNVGNGGTSGNGPVAPGAGAPLASAPNSAPSSGATPPAGGGNDTSEPSESSGSPGDGASSGGGSAGKSTKSSGRGGGAGGGGGSSLSGTVANTVGETVSGVDDATGGALDNAGVTPITEEVVKGAAGPESPLGETVDKAAEKVGETVGGLLPGDR